MSDAPPKPTSEMKKLKQSLDALRRAQVRGGNGKPDDPQTQLAALFAEFREEVQRIESELPDEAPSFMLDAPAQHLNVIASTIDRNTGQPPAGNLSNFRTHASNFLASVSPLRVYAQSVNFARLKKTQEDEFQRLLGTAHERALAEMKSRAEAAEKATSEAQANAEAKLKSIGEMVDKAATAKFARDFAAQAEAHRRAAMLWGLFTAVLAIVTGVAVYFVGKLQWPRGQSAANETAIHAIERVSIRVIALSLLVSALVWTSRIFRAHKHGQFVNTHRKHALDTFPLLRDTLDSNDRETRGAVVLKAVDAIFTPQPTGFLPTEPEPPPTSTAIELIERISRQR